VRSLGAGKMADHLSPSYFVINPLSGSSLVRHGESADQYILLIWQLGGLFLCLVAVVMGLALVSRQRSSYPSRSTLEGLNALAEEIASPQPRFQSGLVQYLRMPKLVAIDPQESRILLHATLGFLNSPAAILDDGGHPIDGNDAWLDFSGSFSWPAMGRIAMPPPDRRFMGSERRDCIFDAFRGLMEGARHSFKTVYFREIDRRKHIFEFSATRVDSNGLPRILVVHEDITEKKNAANQLKELSRRTSDIQQAERQRIAREIHDSTSQHLVAINLNLINLRREINGTGHVDKLLDDIERSANDAQQEIRLFSYLLYPSQLEQSGAKATIEHYVRGFSRRAQIEAHADICDEVDALDIDVQQSLLRVVQEALANVHRHAKATSALVKIAPNKSGLFAMIVDDGIGMKSGLASEASASSGVGIPGMMSRVQELGGSFNVMTSSKGTSVVVEIPWFRPGQSEFVPARGMLN
jgi:signal transduction histidine kinase